ncbi:hypothetical protein F4808DRAFT_458519 [Astrocystis sublimbata]|nr:hypothetical protein F4808DRAFT_458519 [Astrocystis sublimbata]
MPSYYYDRYYGYRPSLHIVHNGPLIIDDHYYSSRSGKNIRSNTFIYNSPDTTMYIESRKGKSHYYYPECRGCFRRRERYYDGYCSGCATYRMYRPRRHETITWNDRRYLDYPERRSITWR